MEIGIIGLPNSGKSTLFNALSKAAAAVAPYAFTTIEPNVGIVPVPDSRFDKIVALLKPAKVVPATVKFVDIAGLVKGASQGEGLGNKFLGHIREVDALVHLVRCFNADTPRVENQIGPAGDIETINTEMALADLATCQKRIQKLEKTAKSGDKEAQRLLPKLEELMQMLSRGDPAINYKEISDFADLYLLTAKPQIFVANISEKELRNNHFGEAQEVQEVAQRLNSDCIIISAKVEGELSELDEEDASIFREELGVSQSGLNQLVQAAYRVLGLRSFYTIESNECRSWAINKGATAIEAAAKIHTDFASGFVKAEVVNYAQLLEDGSFALAKEKGNLQIEGKEYIVQDGDVIKFKLTP